MKMKSVWLAVLVLVSLFGLAAFADVVPVVEETTPLTAEEIAKAAEIEAMTASITTLETSIAGKKTALESTTLTSEERAAFEAELAVLTTELETKTEALAALNGVVAPVVLTEEEIKALEVKAETLKTQIAALEAQLADPASTLDEAAKAALVLSLEGLKTDLVEVQTALDSTEGPNPNALRFQNAAMLGITPGKMHLLEKLLAASGGTEINLVEWSQKSVKDINGAIKNYKKGILPEDPTVMAEATAVVEKVTVQPKKEHPVKGKKDKK